MVNSLLLQRMGREHVSTSFSVQKRLTPLYSGGGAEWRGEGTLLTMAGTWLEAAESPS